MCRLMPTTSTYVLYINNFLQSHTSLLEPSTPPNPVLSAILHTPEHEIKFVNIVQSLNGSNILISNYSLKYAYQTVLLFAFSNLRKCFCGINKNLSPDIKTV